MISEWPLVWYNEEEKETLMKRGSTESALRKARLMRGNGITYDTGFFNAGVSTHEPFDPGVVKREMRIIHDDLHCNAVRITGGNADRLEIAAIHAADASLEVWFSPFTCDLTTDELLDFLADCAERAERLRRQGAEVVRERFGGKISYASIPFEGVDWRLFDFISVDAYRSIAVADRYRDAIRTLVAQGKPVAITEFGCATFQGAADRGASGGMIVEYDNNTPSRLDGDYIREEAEQATYLRELLAIFTAEGVDTAFANTFASYHLPHRRDPRADLDMASYGVVKVLEDRLGHSYPDMAWEPKAAFTALADYYHG